MNLFKKYKLQLLLLVIVSIIGLVNYQPGTYLTGWDNLQTELAPALGVKRAFFAVWQQYQSFGLVGGMAHAADLLRASAVWFLTLLLPQSLVRYGFHLGMYAIGALGAFTLLKHTEENNQKPFAFLGSLFYLLNFATIQLFFLPFEPFSIFFASLPWLIWIFIKSVSSPTHRLTYVATFFLLNLLATPSFYVQTLFVIYVFVLGALTLGMRVHVKKAIILGSLVLVANLFWILPQAYFLKTNGSVIANSKINQLATEDVYYQNKAKGDILSFISMRGLYTDLKGPNAKPLFEQWNNPVVQLATIGLFGITLLGMSRKNSFRFPFLLIWSLCAFSLLSAVPGISHLHDLIRKNDLISQIFRSPFTKFAIPLALSSSFFFMQGIAKFAQKKILIYLMLLLLLLSSYPAFTGHLFSDKVRNKIPAEYFQTMDYFKGVNKDNRIALLPQDSFWGWYNYSWGYSGSGFLWYGIEQPIVSPTFDVWSAKSESYLWEMKSALATGEASKVNTVLKKYNIHYVLLDESVLPTTTYQKDFSASRIKEQLNSNEAVQLEKQYGSISIYKVLGAVPFVTNGQHLPKVGPVIDKTDVDTAYALLGNYYSTPVGENEEQPEFYFPFLSFFSQTKTHPQTWHLEEHPTTFLLKTQLPSFKGQLYATQPVNSLTASVQDLPAGRLGALLRVTFNKEVVETVDVTNVQPTQCEKLTVCLAYSLPTLPHEHAYLIKVVNENSAGRRLFFYIQENTQGNAVIEDRLTADTQYYTLPPGNHFGYGYTFGFQNDSYKGIESENSLTELEVYRLPLAQIQALYATSGVTPEVASAVIYNQAYDPGWMAYINGKPLSNHVIINNWANGWIVPSTSSGQVTFFFWPQVLEFAGLSLIGIIGLIGLLRFIIKSL